MGGDARMRLRGIRSWRDLRNIPHGAATQRQIRAAIRVETDAFVALVTPVYLERRRDREDLVWNLELPPRGEWTCEFNVPLKLGPAELQPIHHDFGDVSGPPKQDPISQWREQRPQFETDSYLLRQVIVQSARDLLALKLEAAQDDVQVVVPAAGLPWFLTLFGRDTLITAYQTVSFGPLSRRCVASSSSLTITQITR